MKFRRPAFREFAEHRIELERHAGVEGKRRSVAAVCALTCLDRPVDYTYDGHGNRVAWTVPLPPKAELTAAKQRSQRGTDNLLRVMEVRTGRTSHEKSPSESEG